MKKIVFVCNDNSGRSKIAEDFAKIYGTDDLEICRFEDHPDMEYDYLVAMGNKEFLPDIHAKHRLDWIVPNPNELPIYILSSVRTIIEKKVKELIHTISHN